MLILVWVEGASEVVRQRLMARKRAALLQDDSGAGREISDSMKPRREKISRNHLVVDTSQDIADALHRILRATNR
jgi:dephospho-CoA kinase